MLRPPYDPRAGRDHCGLDGINTWLPKRTFQRAGPFMNCRHRRGSLMSYRSKPESDSLFRLRTWRPHLCAFRVGIRMQEVGMYVIQRTSIDSVLVLSSKGYPLVPLLPYSNSVAPGCLRPNSRIQITPRAPEVLNNSRLQTIRRVLLWVCCSRGMLSLLHTQATMSRYSQEGYYRRELA